MKQITVTMQEIWQLTRPAIHKSKKKQIPRKRKHKNREED